MGHGAFVCGRTNREFLALLDADIGVDIDDEVFSLDLDGVDLEAVEGDLVAGGGGGAGEGLAEEVGGVDFHF